MAIIKNPKCKQVMTKLLEPGFQITNEQLELFLQHIMKSPEKAEPKVSDDCSTIVISDDEDDDENKDSFVFSWLNQALDVWETTGKISPQGINFILNLMISLSKNEDTFVLLNMQKILKRLLNFLLADKSLEYTDNELNYCKLFSTFLNHKSGFDWVLSNNLTEQVISAAVRCENFKIFKEYCDFIGNVLDKCVENNSLLCKKILGTLVVPVFVHLANMLTDNSEEINVSKPVIIHLNLLIGILEKLLELSCTKNNFKIFTILKENFNFNKYMKNLRSLSNLQNGILESNVLLVLLIFFELGSSFKNNLDATESQETMYEPFNELTTIAKEITKKHKFLQNYELCHKCLLYFNWIKNLVPDSGTSYSFQFEMQIVVLQLLPVMVCTHSNLHIHMRSLVANNDLRQISFHKMIKDLSELTMRVMVELRQEVTNVAISDGLAGLLCILKSKNFYSRQTIKYLIQTIVNIMEDVLYAIENVPENCGNLTEEYLSGTFDVIIEFVQEFNVRWSESLTMLSLTETSYKFLSYPIASADLVAKGLQLLNIAISQHMSPTLVLLVDDSEQTLIDNIASMLQQKLVHPAREVRKNVLEIIYTIASYSKTKFPSFRQAIQKNNFPFVVFTIAVNDIDSSVKMEALKCLQQMLQVANIRRNVLNIPYLNEQLIQMLYLDADICVPMEASNVITEIYDLDTMENTSGTFCNIMSQMIFEGKEKKLKIKILNFWHKVIDVFFRRQGILDGQFPEATFSKQLKRIIHFDRQTIRSSLYNILNDLSQNGCLAIFVHVFREESDFDLCSATKDCFEDLINLLKNNEITFSSTTTSDYFSSPCNSLSPDSDFSVEHISPSLSPIPFLTDFESIDVQELGILDDLVFPRTNNSMTATVDSNTFSTDFTMNNDCVFKCRQIVKPDDFLKYIYNEFEYRYTQLQLKVNSEHSVERLLDQILSNSLSHSNSF